MGQGWDLPPTQLQAWDNWVPHAKLQRKLCRTLGSSWSGPAVARDRSPTTFCPHHQSWGHQLLVRASSSPGPHPGRGPRLPGTHTPLGLLLQPPPPLPVHPESPPGRGTGLTPRRTGSSSPRQVEWVLSSGSRSAGELFPGSTGNRGPQPRDFQNFVAPPWTVLARPWLLGPLCSCGPE